MLLNTTSFRLAIAILILMTGPLTGVARAQGRPAPAAQIAIGWVGFADDGVVSEFLAGGEAGGIWDRESPSDQRSSTSGATTTVTSSRPAT